jgi:hypothetical protein
VVRLPVFRRTGRRPDIAGVEHPAGSRPSFGAAARASLAAGIVALCACAHGSPPPEGGVEDREPRRASLLPDVSGLAWIGGNRFLAVHDAKYPDEAASPRVSLLELPTGLDGIRWTPLDVAFPDQPASDLESAARIPGAPDRFLIAESSEDASARPFANRIFLVELSDGGAAVVDHAEWPVATTNVEGIAVAEVGNGLVFLFAERAHGEPSSEIRFAELTLDPLAFGAFRSAGRFTSPGPGGPAARPVAALEVDARGFVYTASTEDPDDDGGPFRSAVYRIGRVDPVEGVVRLDAAPTLMGALDGLKVESVAAREPPDGALELWVGVDDEYYGGTMRPLPARASASP